MQKITSPDTSAQNGIPERLNRTLIEHAKAEVKAAGLAHEFWSLAVKHVTWVRNRIWHKALTPVAGGPSFSPYHILYGRAPRVSMSRVFDCDSWRLDFSVKKGSFEPKGKKCIYVGSSANRKGWVLFDPQTRRLRTTFHCVFDESLENRRCRELWSSALFRRRTGHFRGSYTPLGALQPPHTKPRNSEQKR